MIVEVEGRRYELDWRGIAVLLALRWIKFNALPLTRLQVIERDLGKLRALLEELKASGLLGQFAVGRITIIFLREEGVKVAEKLEEIARNSRIL